MLWKLFHETVRPNGKIQVANKEQLPKGTYTAVLWKEHRARKFSFNFVFYRNGNLHDKTYLQVEIHISLL